MGWFSSSASSDANPTTQSTLQPPSQISSPPSTQPIAQTTPTSPPTQLQPEPQPQLPSPTPSQPIDADADFHAAFPHLAPSPSPDNSSELTAHTTLNPHQTASTSNASVYPTTMSCRAAFDSAFYCSSLGGHFNDIYRYGQLRACSEHWADWRFCMGLKSRGREAKEAAVQDRYRDKEEKVRGRANSEDVWRRRMEGERVVDPFGRAGEE